MPEKLKGLVHGPVWSCRETELVGLVSSHQNCLLGPMCRVIALCHAVLTYVALNEISRDLEGEMLSVHMPCGSHYWQHHTTCASSQNQLHRFA